MGEKPRQEDQLPTPESRGPNAEHLAEGYYPIMACVGTMEEYGEEILLLKEITNVGHNSNYSGNAETLNRHGFKADNYENEYPSYVISPIDEKPKFTEGLFDCISLVAVGRSKDENEEISFLTHQDPKGFLRSQKDFFAEDIEQSLEEIKGKCLEGSIDIVIAGGKILQDKPEDYKNSLDYLSQVIEEKLGFKPLVVCGPKFPHAGPERIYFDTQKRRLYIVRPGNSNFSNDVFPAKNIKKMQKKWRRDGMLIED